MTPRETKYHRRRKRVGRAKRIARLEAKQAAILICQERIIKAIQLSQLVIESAQQTITTHSQRVSIMFADPSLN